MITLDVSRHEVRVSHKRVYLRPKEFLMLKAFSDSDGVILTRKDLSDKINCTQDEGSRMVDQHISRLRKKIGNRAILTVTKFGYRLNESIDNIG